MNERGGLVQIAVPIFSMAFLRCCSIMTTTTQSIKGIIMSVN